MDSSVTFLIFIIAICIALSAFFSSSETALFSLNKYRLQSAVEQKRYGALSAAKLMSQPEKFISMILICNNIVNIAASALATIVGQLIYGDLGIAIATGILTFVLLMFAEIIPKTLAAKFSEEVSFAFSPILVVIFKIIRPVVFFFDVFTKLFFKLFRIKTDDSALALSNDELRVIVKESKNVVGKEHSDMLNAILDLEEVSVEEIMIPRYEINAIDIDDDFKSILKQLNHSTNSRVVIYREYFEKQILGILRIKEAYRLMLENNDFSKTMIIKAIDEPLYIPEGTSLTRQLYNFKKQKRKLGLVVDEYGYVIGLITIEDILEEIVGNFTVNSVVDEEEDINYIARGKYIIDGQTNLRDLNKLFSWNLHEEEARTINGFLLEHFQDIPKEGSIYLYKPDNLEFKVLKVNTTKILEIEITDHNRYKPSQSEGEEGQEINENSEDKEQFL